MPTWNAEQYLRFSEERTRPCRDLAARVELSSPARVIDLGCGPGNSTEVLAARWPSADLTGLDSSPEMIAAAREKYPGRHWVVADLNSWAGDGSPFNVVFSNAAIQWVDDHASALPRLFAQVAPGGAFAMQMPGNWDGPAHRLMRELASSPSWRARFTREVREWHVHDLPFYFDVLAPHAERLDLWETEYVHVMDGPEAIVEWYKGTGLRPFLDALPNEADRARFTAEYLEQIRKAYSPRKSGAVLFPFRRLFVMAYRSNGES